MDIQVRQAFKPLLQIYFPKKMIIFLPMKMALTETFKLGTTLFISSIFLKSILDKKKVLFMS